MSETSDAFKATEAKVEAAVTGLKISGWVAVAAMVAANLVGVLLGI